MANPRTVRLTSHPAAHGGVVRGIGVVVTRAADGTLRLAYRLSGDVASVRVPPPCRPRIAERLWQHTCFEAFVGCEGERAYHELNLSPSGEWAVFAFRDTRDGAMLDDESLAPSIVLRKTDDAIELRAAISLVRLSRVYGGASLRLGLSTVVEACDGTRTYWALRHPAAEPDFHHHGAFALRLEAP